MKRGPSSDTSISRVQTKLMRLQFLAVAIFLIAATLYAEDSGLGDAADLAPLTPASILPTLNPAITPILPELPQPPRAEPKVNWSGVFMQSLSFMTLQHGFRYWTEPGTRHPGTGAAKGYLKSVGNLHGWSDGDPFLVNYVGHPMQGALSGFIWAQNDGKYQRVEFGKNREYWKSRLRAGAFAWAYSTQFEIGPISEASIGNVQRYLPQQGFVDHVVTPTVGLAWMIAEDALDKYFISWVEKKVSNPIVRIAVRGGLNPSRTMATVFRGERPWVRETRSDVFVREGSSFVEKSSSDRTVGAEANPAVAQLDVTAVVNTQSTNGRGCSGGGGVITYALNDNWRLVGDVRGCQMGGFATNSSGDSISYMAGVRWLPSVSTRWTPYVEVLVGGVKVNQETIDVARKEALLAEQKELDYKTHQLYRLRKSSHGISVSAGTGVDWNVNGAFGVRVASLAYGHSWLRPIDGAEYRTALQFSSGVVLRFGTW